MKRIFFTLTLLASLSACSNEFRSKEDYANAMVLDTTQFNTAFTTYREKALFHRRFKHSDVDSLIQQHKQKGIIAAEAIGKSVEQRAIYKLQYGAGKKKVMLWSQMHGDEPTATMALFDLFNFLEGKDDGFDTVRSLLKENLTLHFIPMLNPDGAERYMRRNAQFIDMNRDARDGQTVEGALLRKMAQEIKPRYAFNLHDQNIYYNVPETKNPVTISLLAPAYNYERDINDIRQGAMQLIVGMNKILQAYIPDAVAKYDDTHTPRGFGDNFQGWGASTVLIESGGKKGDPEKQEIRKLNFIIILNALIEIAQGTYQQYDYKAYEAIPFNASQMHDVVIRNVDLGNDTVPLKTDVAIRRGEVTVGRDYFVRGRVEDIGDLDESYGYDEFDAKGLELVQGKTWSREIDSVSVLSFDDAWNLLKEGYMAVKVKDISDGRLHNLPLVLFTQQRFTAAPNLVLSGPTNFFLGKGAKLKYAVVNGYLINLEEKPKSDFFKNRVN
ncbi:peptidase M14 [Sphingobacterium psychroaquaticum]|uniref:M14 family zinc carboxypeptidase n=1 Tax=Sphingobacterium psychroaquaticum TaxID=561061 RepID=UPI00106C30F1|nr:M14 family zinc carboxypeptidase [Sphingobacterium psychroaquaticum]QBQ41009.1 peptidase M14 [Sphingobacterium psychroaquaticum]